MTIAQHSKVVEISKCRVRLDTRTTQEVEETRSFVNQKPYRSKEEKKLAKAYAKKVNGAWVCDEVPVHYDRQTGSARREKDHD
jgi:hypothetical protein